MGFTFNEKTNMLEDVHKPINELLPMVNPVDFVIHGWDISKKNLFEACKRAHVLEPTLLEQLKDDLSSITPLPAALNPEFIATN